MIEKGQRKMGVCKEERKLPIVQMGLFMDDDGIPISIETFPGNTLDQLTLRPALKKNIDGLDFSRFIMIADRGICNYMNMLHLLDGGNGYIVSKSLLKSTNSEQECTYDDNGYTSVSADFKYKSRIMKRHVNDKNGNSRTLEYLERALSDTLILQVFLEHVSAVTMFIFINVVTGNIYMQ